MSLHPWDGVRPTSAIWGHRYNKGEILMNRLYAFRWLLFWLLPFMTPAFADSESASALTANPTSLSLQVGKQATVSLTNVNGSLKVASSNQTVATGTVSGNTLTVTAKAQGSTTFTVQDRKNTVSIKVTVTTPPLSVSTSTVSLLVGQAVKVNIANASGSVRVAVANTSIATATLSGTTLTVTGKAAGSTQVTVRDQKTSVVIGVTVSKSAPAPTLSASPTSLSLAVGQKSTVALANASGTITASVANSSIATATLSGTTLTVTGKAAGSTQVTVRDQKTSVVIGVTVSTSAPAPTLSASPMAVTLTAGQKATVAIANASGALSASVANTAIATATLSGSTLTVTGVAAGSTKVTVSDQKYSVVISVTVSATAPPPTATGTYTLLAWNDLGMHCMDGRDYSVFSILPPYNNLHAQLIDTTNNQVVSQGVTLTYESLADPTTGSINTISSTKTNFWQYVAALFGSNVAPDVGLTGSKAPSLVPSPLSYNATTKYFEAVAIPLTPYDDSLSKNYYPLVRVVAKDSAGNQLAQARVVLPVSDEMSCSSCHASNSSSAAKPAAGWINDPNSEVDWKKNILRLHDEKQASDSVFKAALSTMGYPASGLLASANAGKPVLCGSCHSSNALGTAGAAGVKPLTEALHGLHATVKDTVSGLALDSIANRDACYQCHPGSQTKCLRGVMGNAVDASGNMAIQCQSCHGSMSNVGKTGRVGWLQEPNCQSCHHDSTRELTAVDASGNLKAWLDTTFATTANAPQAPYSLYRFSTGHGGLQCEACHGATHAEYPTSHPNDNILSTDVQGHAGTVTECVACHKTVPTTNNGGPHGMHTIGQTWVSSHKSYAKSNKAACSYCHGADFRGTPLSAAKVARTLTIENSTKSFAAGHQFNCYDCHNGPNGG